METLVLSSAQNNFAGVIARVEKGNEIAIVHDGSNEAVAVIVPFAAWKKKLARELGSLCDHGPVHFADSFSMSDDELLNP
jgi:prevent-host-death family protein